MDGTQIQSLINLGYIQAANAIGTSYSQYRPTVSTTKGALDASFLLQSLPASFAQKGDYTKPGTVKNDEWIGYFDGSQTQPGDYLTNGTRTFFIASQQILLPYLCVACNRVMTLIRPAAVSAAGVTGYGGSTATTQTVMAYQWPASALQGTKGERGDVTMPDDVKSPWWAIRLPVMPGVTIQADDILTDDLSRRYSVSSAELTEYGWRLTARQNLG